VTPTAPGASTRMLPEALEEYSYEAP
jgi:hypothetical protein